MLYILSIIVANAPQLVPEVWGFTEPPEEMFDSRNIESIASKLRGSSIIWKTKKGRITGTLSAGSPRYHYCVDICGAAQLFVFEQMSTVLNLITNSSPVDFGYLHLVSEVEGTRLNRQIFSTLDQLTTTFDLKHGIPTLAWTTVLGAPFVTIFGKDRLLSAPAFRSTEIACARVAIQLTEAFTDPVKNLDVFQRNRESVICHLGVEAFWNQINAAFASQTPMFHLGQT